MLRALILIAAFLLFREFLPRRRRHSSTATSPYMNSLDGMLSAEQVSLVMDEVRLRDTGSTAKSPPHHPSATAA
jgi:hypothetical protein